MLGLAASLCMSDVFGPSGYLTGTFILCACCLFNCFAAYRAKCAY